MSLEGALAESVRRLADTNPCEENQSGYCEAHLSDAPCAHAQALDLLAQYDAARAAGRPDPTVEVVDETLVELLDVLAEIIAPDACRYEARGRCITHDQPSAEFNCPQHRAAVILGRIGG